MPGWVGVTRWAGVFVLVGISMFWAVADHSAAVGTSRAREFEATSQSKPSVAVFSAESLSLRAPEVLEVLARIPARRTASATRA